MLATAIPNLATFERTVERVRRAARSLRVREQLAERRRLLGSVGGKPEIRNLIHEKAGYAILPVGLIDSVPAAVKFAQGVRDSVAESASFKKKADYNPTILNPKRYEEAPALFDLTLCDDVLRIACDYFGEIPILTSIRLWWTPVNDRLQGSQLYHRDGQKWLLRRVKFLFNMSDVDDKSGPFTFLPASLSDRIAHSLGSIKEQDRVSDETIYRFATAGDAISLVGKAGTGAVVDSSRCFHYGARAREKDRLLLQFQFLRLADAVQGGSLRRTPAFAERFGDDPVRRLVVPNEE